jgi:putative ABC transport system permease protein
MKYTLLILKNLLRSKRRTILTMLSIAVSLFIFSALVSLPNFANQVLADTSSSVRIACRTKMGLDYPLPEAYKSKIAATPHVVAVVPDVFFGGIYHDITDQFPNIAVDPEQIDLMWPDWGFSSGGVDQFKKLKTACIVADGTMHRFNLHVGQQIQLRGTAFPFNVVLTIVGTVAHPPAPSFLMFRRDYFEEVAGRPGIAHNFWVRVDSSSVVPQVTAALDQMFANSSAETQSDSEAAFLGSIIGRFRTFFRLAELLGLVVVIAIGLVAANTAAMSIREKRGEIAVMRSMGFPARTLLSLLVAESVIIAVVGGILGCGGAFSLLKVFSFNADALGPFATLRIPPWVLVEALIVSVLIGLFSAWFPARSAAQRSIAESLRVID